MLNVEKLLPGSVEDGIWIMLNSLMFLAGYIFLGYGINIAVIIINLLSNKYPPFLRGPFARGPLFFHFYTRR
jgi:hypothetical protein